jgi:hypothetical protein
MVYSVPRTVKSNLKLGKAKDGVRAAGSLVAAGAKVVSGTIRHTRKPKPKPTFVPLNSSGSLPVHPGDRPDEGTTTKKREWRRNARKFNRKMPDQSFIQQETRVGYSRGPDGKMALRPTGIGHQTFSNDSYLTEVSLPGKPSRVAPYSSTKPENVAIRQKEGNRLKARATKITNRNMSAQQAAINKRLS